MSRITALSCCLALSLSLAHGHPGQQDAVAGSIGSTQPFLDRLQQRALVYRHAVLRFSCNEALLEETVEPQSGDLKNRRESTYRYLLQSDPEERDVSEYRQILEKDGVPVRVSPAVIQTSIPPPYLWATLFDPENAAVFRYEILGRERRGVTDTVIVGFKGQLGFQEGNRIGEWSGRIWIDRDRLNPVHLEAEPAHQEEALKAELDKYRQAFRLGSVRLKSPPKAYILSVEFLVNRYGLTFPSQATWRRNVLDARGDHHTDRMVRRTFGDYRFFDIRTDQIIDNPAPE